jgi:general L-amino acid transport system substrate-binding protein
MKGALLAAALTVAGLASSSAEAGTLEQVRERGTLRCGTNEGLVGFAAKDANGVWQGFDVSLCRAIAAAVLGDPQAVDFIPLSAQERFAELGAGSIDVLVRNSAWTLSSDTGLGFDFKGVNYFDGQAFMVRRDLGITSAKDLADASVCFQTGTSAQMNLEGFFRVNTISYRAMPVDSDAEGQARYLAGDCDVYTTNASALAATRATFKTPADHVILPEMISKEPLGPVVRHGDNAWGDIVGWTLNAMIAAEELGVTSVNVRELASAPIGNPEIDRLLGTEGNLGAMMGLDRDWAVRVIAAVGNYGEVFERHIGEATPLGLARGLNAQYTQGGLLYALPFR